jgi:hypothetical protein
MTGAAFPQVSARSPRLAGGVLLVALAVAGCGSSSGGVAADHGTSSGKPASKATGSPSGPAGRPSASASPPPPPRPTASDGTRYAACADGTCEVAVARPVHIAVDGGTLVVTKVKREDSVEFDLTLANGGGGSGTLKGTCGTIFTFYPGGGGAGTMCSSATSKPTRPSPVPGALSMQLAGWDADHAAVLRLVSG